MKSTRNLFFILSPKALPYFEQCVKSLFLNALEPLDIKLISDSADDKQTLCVFLSKIDNPLDHKWQVFDKSDVDERGNEKFRTFKNLQAFGNGHPCWRKITDPLVFANDGEEIIVLDPDLYFPNKFTFEPTPEGTILLMWQPPSCLQPPESVQAAFNASVKLAHHVDIGVAQWRKPVDLEWLDWFLGELGGKNIPRSMFVEAIVWSALAMKIGGAYLEPRRWHCYYNSHWKRVLIKSGFPMTRLLQMENLRQAKCFHATGPCKWWIKEASEKGMFKSGNTLDQPSKIFSLVEFTSRRYELEQNIKSFLRKIGYYSFIDPQWTKLEQFRRNR